MSESNAVGATRQYIECDDEFICGWARHALKTGRLDLVALPEVALETLDNDDGQNPCRIFNPDGSSSVIDTKCQREILDQVIPLVRSCIEKFTNDDIDGCVFVESTPKPSLEEAYRSSWGYMYTALRVAAAQALSLPGDQDSMITTHNKGASRYSYPNNFVEFTKLGLGFFPHRDSTSGRPDVLIPSTLSPWMPGAMPGQKHVYFVPPECHQVYAVVPESRIEAAHAEVGGGTETAIQKIYEQIFSRCNHLFHPFTFFPLDRSEFNIFEVTLFALWAEENIDYLHPRFDGNTHEVSKEMYLAMMEPGSIQTVHRRLIEKNIFQPTLPLENLEQLSSQSMQMIGQMNLVQD